MSLTLTNQTGNLLTIPVWTINEESSTKSVIVPCSGNKDVVQVFGRQNRVYDITGIARTSDEMIFITNLKNFTGSMLFSTDINIVAGPDFDPNDFSSSDFRTTTYSESLGLIETDMSNRYFFGPNNFINSSFTSTDIPLPVYFENLEWHDNAQRPFEKRFNLRVRELAGLSITGGGGSTIPVLGEYQYDTNSVIGVQAIPDNSHIFLYWLVDGFNVGSTNPYFITMDTNHTIEAIFQ